MVNHFQNGVFSLHSLFSKMMQDWKTSECGRAMYSSRSSGLLEVHSKKGCKDFLNGSTIDSAQGTTKRPPQKPGLVFKFCSLLCCLQWEKSWTTPKQYSPKCQLSWHTHQEPSLSSVLTYYRAQVVNAHECCWYPTSTAKAIEKSFFLVTNKDMTFF